MKDITTILVDHQCTSDQDNIGEIFTIRQSLNGNVTLLKNTRRIRLPIHCLIGIEYDANSYQSSSALFYSSASGYDGFTAIPSVISIKGEIRLLSKKRVSKQLLSVFSTDAVPLRFFKTLRQAVPNHITLMKF